MLEPTLEPHKIGMSVRESLIQLRDGLLPADLRKNPLAQWVSHDAADVRLRAVSITDGSPWIDQLQALFEDFSKELILFYRNSLIYIGRQWSVSESAEESLRDASDPKRLAGSAKLTRDRLRSGEYGLEEDTFALIPDALEQILDYGKRHHDAQLSEARQWWKQWQTEVTAFKSTYDECKLSLENGSAEVASGQLQLLCTLMSKTPSLRHTLDDSGIHFKVEFLGGERARLLSSALAALQQKEAVSQPRNSRDEPPKPVREALTKHRIKVTHTHPLRIKRDNPVAPAWPSFTGTSQFVGTSPSGRVSVYVDVSLGAQALQNAQDLVNDADRVATANDGLFGTTGGPVSVVVFALGGNTDGTGGADHMGCDYTNGAAIEVDASFGNSARVSALFEAELSECSMNGNLCGLSTGEALSRWCAAVIGNNALSDFATAPQWVQDGEPDFVDQTDPTDQNADSIGCGMVFISWLISQGHGLEQIAPAMVNLGDSGTLAQLYANLTSDSASNAWANFQNAIQNLPSGANSITHDDPFGGLAQPMQMANLAPRTAELVGRVFATLISAVSAGRQPEQIAASVRSAMIPASNSGQALVCKPGSKRLLPPKKARRSTKTA